ncbi:MAG: response regulator [Spirochaetales bacterium]|nr:response regulator [Spirochaetales bacterium]
MKTIFAVDDSPTARASIELTLKNENFNVQLASDGVDALKKIQNFKGDIDLFIFDINMPNMDGISLINNVRKIETYKYTPILFLTTESQKSKKIEGKKAGASGWIVKPFEPSTLLELIKRFIGA